MCGVTINHFWWKLDQVIKQTLLLDVVLHARAGRGPYKNPLPDGPPGNFLWEFSRNENVKEEKIVWANNQAFFVKAGPCRKVSTAAGGCAARAQDENPTYNNPNPDRLGIFSWIFLWECSLNKHVTEELSPDPDWLPGNFLCDFYHNVKCNKKWTCELSTNVSKLDQVVQLKHYCCIYCSTLCCTRAGREPCRNITNMKTLIPTGLENSRNGDVMRSLKCKVTTVSTVLLTAREISRNEHVIRSSECGVRIVSTILLTAWGIFSEFSDVIRSLVVNYIQYM